MIALVDLYFTPSTPDSRLRDKEESVVYLSSLVVVVLF